MSRKTAFGVSQGPYRLTLEELLYGLGQGSTSATIHKMIMHALALSFVGILVISVARRLQHEQIGEGCIDDKGLGTTNLHLTAITPTSNKALTSEETELHTIVNATLQFFLDLLNVIGGDLHTGKITCFLIFHR
jgi:hypothetical protein